MFLNRAIFATFSEAMRAESITKESFTLMQGTTSVDGAVTTVDAVATFTPTGNLQPNTVYTAKIASGVLGHDGSRLVDAKTWSFTTGTQVDTTAPVIISTSPAAGDKGVYINRLITATFSEDMAATTLNGTTFTLKQGAAVVSGTVTVAGVVATFRPSTNLGVSTEYTATITTEARDLADNALAVTKTWSFNTGDASDVTAPAVLTTDPADGSFDIAANRSLSATFSEAIDQTTIVYGTFTLMQGTTRVLGTLTSSGSVATFTPNTNLALNTLYTATLAGGVKDLAGNASNVGKTWSFTTGAVLAKGPAPLILGTAGNFVILSKAGITNVATSVITGDLGTSPITGASIVGLDCVQVVGKIYQVDPTGPACAQTDSVYLTTAIGDMEIAYADAAGRTSPDGTELGAGEIGGLTIAPGLYKWGTDVLISNDVKISGGASDVWIFQIARDLKQASGMRMILEGGAQAKNIFWQVAGEVSLGTTAHAEGTILSGTLIALKTGAVMNGRALAQTAVTLESNTVHIP